MAPKEAPKEAPIDLAAGYRADVIIKVTKLLVDISADHGLNKPQTFRRCLAGLVNYHAKDPAESNIIRFISDPSTAPIGTLRLIDEVCEAFSNYEW